MRFYSTNLKAPPVDLGTALLVGQAPDKGLYMPEQIPVIPKDEIYELADQPYPEVAFAVMRRWTSNLLPDDELLKICYECYNYPVPLENVVGNRFLMRLDRGPTASFKDFAARMMARLLRHILKQSGGELVILTATSGDTGSAVAHAFHNVDRIRMVVLFPIAEVSARQRKQMTTLGGNVTTIGIDGKFDDCQALVKRAFADPELKPIPFSSANSINIGRLLPQSVYYFYAYAQLAEKGTRAVFCVPSGNFGNMCAGMLAWRMGLPAERFIIATNENDEFPKFLQTGTYEKIVPSRKCISNAMNVGHPSNLPRLVALYSGVMDEQGNITKPPDLKAMQRDIFALSITDRETRQTIVNTYQKYHILLEPHGAVGWAALERYGAEKEPNLAIAIETAHPAKFPEEIKSLLGIEPEPPEALLGLDTKPENYETGPADYDWFKDYLKKSVMR
ncbi:MAG: threonine synthase [candidate division WOR-3 bacterium]|jgi:threonine synthase|nr:threonine synthase [candidate division WOR-3 bacterium]MCR4424045.1 threonine synthase [candidate division WOR-3 bacterium]MDH7519536.1 threonine synthase [bacterium]